MKPLKSSVEMIAETIAVNGMGIPTGFSQLDSMLRGLTKGELTLIAGRSSMGKSSAMIDWALNISKTTPVGIFSLEMSEQEIVERMITNIQETNLYDLKSGKEKVGEETKRNLESRIILFDDTAGISTLDISHSIGKCGEIPEVVFVDYLQLIRAGSPRAARYEIVDNICQELRNLAKEKNIAIVLLCQLNRDIEKRESHRPRLSDLRESGGIEQTADKIVFLYRPSYYAQYDQQERKNYGDDSEAYFIVAKNRNGRLGDVPVVWLPEYMKFKPTTFDLETF